MATARRPSSGAANPSFGAVLTNRVGAVTPPPADSSASVTSPSIGQGVHPST